MADVSEIKTFLIEQTQVQIYQGVPRHKISRENAHRLAEQFLPDMRQQGMSNAKIVRVVGEAAQKAADEIEQETGIRQLLSNAEFARMLYPDKQPPRSR